jgi:hypothetical protein
LGSVKFSHISKRQKAQLPCNWTTKRRLCWPIYHGLRDNTQSFTYVWSKEIDDERQVPLLRDALAFIRWKEAEWHTFDLVFIFPLWETNQ